MTGDTVTHHHKYSNNNYVVLLLVVPTNRLPSATVNDDYVDLRARIEKGNGYLEYEI